MERKDLKELLKAKNESWWGTHSVLIANEDDQNNWFDNIDSSQLFMVALNQSGNLLGVVTYSNINWLSRTLFASIVVFKEYRSNSSVHIFEAALDFAFEMLNMHRVEGEVADYHLPAQKLEINHLGFTVEGRKRSSIYKCGTYYDSLVLGILRNEWQSCNRVASYNGSCNLNFDKNLFNKLASKCLYFK